MYEIGLFVHNKCTNQDLNTTIKVFEKYFNIIKAFHKLELEQIIESQQTDTEESEDLEDEINAYINDGYYNYSNFFKDTLCNSKSIPPNCFEHYIEDITSIIHNEYTNSSEENKKKIMNALTPRMYSISVFKGNTSLNIDDLNIIEHFNYSHMITLLSPSAQIYMWIIRTLLFYELLLQVSEQVTRHDNYKVGIFGSNDVTSDIDIGFTYIPEDVNPIQNTSPLSFAIKTLEDLFITHTGINSLQFDIEPYANFMTLPDGSYYLDTTNMTYDHFLKLAPYVGAGILRNYIQSFIDLGYNPDVRRQKIEDCDKQLITEQISIFYRTLVHNNPTTNGKKVIEGCPGHHTETNINLTEYSLLNVFMQDTTVFATLIHALFGENNQFGTPDESAVGLITSYLLKDYEESRQLYYKYVNNAEKYFYETIVPSAKSNPTSISIDKIIEMLKLSSKADIFRAESYISPITVMDVVRGYQANVYNTFNRDKCSTNTVSPCYIGYYGYIISILENLGYITRFRLTYCNKDHLNKDKCNKKYIKYIQRVNNSFVQLQFVKKPYNQFDFGNDWTTEIQIVPPKLEGDKTVPAKTGMVTDVIHEYLESIQTSHNTLMNQRGGGRHTRSRRPRFTKHKKRHIKKTRKRVRLSKNKRNRNK